MGPVGGQAQGQSLGRPQASHPGHKANDGLHVGEAAWYDGEEALASGRPGFFSCLCDHEPYFPHLLSGATNTHLKELS